MYAATPIVYSSFSHRWLTAAISCAAQRCARAASLFVLPIASHRIDLHIQFLSHSNPLGPVLFGSESLVCFLSFFVVSPFPCLALRSFLFVLLQWTVLCAWGAKAKGHCSYIPHIQHTTGSTHTQHTHTPDITLTWHPFRLTVWRSILNACSLGWATRLGALPLPLPVWCRLACMRHCRIRLLPVVAAFSVLSRRRR